MRNCVKIEEDNLDEISKFVIENGIYDDIIESIKHIRIYFPKDVEISINYISNEEYDEQPQLEFFMESKTEEHLLAYLNKFTVEYWVSKLDNKNLIGKIVFSI